MTGALYSLPNDDDPAPYGTTDEATGEKYILEGGGKDLNADGVADAADGQLALSLLAYRLLR